MTLPPSPFEIPEPERTPLVQWLLNIIAQQQVVIEQQQNTIAQLETKVSQLEEKVGNLDEQLKAAKKLTRLAPDSTEQPQLKGKTHQRGREASRFKQTQQEAELHRR